ncbi:GPN-loop GTPase 3 [Strongyloides ratti]|uniref:GPN-loop GTPase 3 n=1 Tax=Strongyloides ratti TaxID=34506 RepID=A0A090L527_STRRB|nr:GPN-loop GTPase 3 [Strongyloides ratti]CEF64822.1 GPN-loop GTPase 3 [Strongyloides ratti]
MKFGQLVVGPAGSGKSTYCYAIQQHMKTSGKNCFVINLDPAAEEFKYDCHLDIRELISLDDVQEDEELALGPNGGLIFCMEYLMNNLDWLEEAIDAAEDDYFLFDCPGQIELYSHLPVMPKIIEKPNKFISGALTTLSTMVSFELPAINILTKQDLLTAEEKEVIDDFLENNVNSIIDSGKYTKWDLKYKKLTEAIAGVLDDYSLVRFQPLNIKDEESIDDLLLVINNNIQYDENLEVKDRYPEDDDPLDGY